MRGRLALALLVSSASIAGCVIDRSPLGDDPADSGGIDAFSDPRVDASLDAPLDTPRPADANTDAWMDPSIDAWAPDAFVELPDAWAPDAFVVGADAWAPDAPPDAFVPPDACMPRCDGDTLVTCDGARTGCAACGTSAVDATPHCLAIVPSNTRVGHVVPVAAMDAVIDGTVSWDTSSCNRGAMRVGDGSRQLDASQFDVFMPPGGVSVCIFSAPRFELTAGARVTVRGSRPLVLVARDSIVIRPGAVLSVGSANDETTRACALSSAGAGARTGTLDSAGDPGVTGTGTYNPDSGGGGGGFCGAGGRGGNGDGGVLGGAAGLRIDHVGLVPLLGGSPGGNGSGRVGEGGHGGGAVQLSASTILIDGEIVARGGGGLGGGVESGGRLQGAGGGGGSGGAIHLEALTLTIGITSMLDVRGGGGGGAACWDGSAAQIGHCAAATVAPTATDGGSDGCDSNSGGGGASGSVRDGADGDDAYDGNGGGGGSGCIVLRSRVAPPTSISAPSASGVVTNLTPTVR